MNHKLWPLPPGSHISDEHTSLTAKQLELAVYQLAQQLSKMSARCIALELDNGVPWMVLDLAMQQAGIVALPLPAFFTPQQRQHALGTAQPDYVLSDSCHQGQSLWVAGTELRLTKLEYKQQAQAFPKNTQKITFTSGSTGNPKGVCLSNKQLIQVANSLVQRTALSRAKHLCLLPLAVLLENVAGMYAPLLMGGQVHAPSLRTLGFDGIELVQPQRLLTYISTFAPHSLILVPELLKGLVQGAENGWQVPTSLQFIAVGGAKVSAKLIARARQLGLPVYQGYGLSEAGSVVSLATKGSNNLHSVGRPLEHVEYHIEDDELCLVAPHFLGYLGEPHPTEQHYRTGDLVRVEKGELFIVGRKSNRLILANGRNVSPEWPESELLNQTAVTQAVVFGEAQAHLVALLWAPENVSDQQLNSALARVNKALPSYAQIMRYHRLATPLSVDAGHLSANHRPKRAAIAHAFSDILNDLYQEQPKMTFFEQLVAKTEAQRQYLLSAPIISEALAGKVSLDQYVAFLTQAYHHVKHTVPLLMACGARVPEHKEWLRDALAEYIEEELGHQEWILNDIAACGFDKEQARASKPAMATELMVSYAYDTIARNNPLGFFGMVHVLEGTSIALADSAASEIKTSLALPQKAFTYLTSHGALDLEHVKFFQGLMNRITDADDQHAIIHAAQRFYHLYGNIFHSLSAEHGLAKIRGQQVSA